MWTLSPPECCFFLNLCLHLHEKKKILRICYKKRSVLSKEFSNSSKPGWSVCIQVGIRKESVFVFLSGWPYVFVFSYFSFLLWYCEHLSMCVCFWAGVAVFTCLVCICVSALMCWWLRFCFSMFFWALVSVCAFFPPSFVCACECVNACVFCHRAPVAEAPQTDSRPAWCGVDSSGIPMRGAAGLRGSGSKSIILPIAWAPRIKLAWKIQGPGARGKQLSGPRAPRH